MGDDIKNEIPEKYSKAYIEELATILIREWGKELPIDPIEIAKSYDLKPLEGNFDHPNVWGMLDMNQQACIVSASDSYLRKRFSLAHGFGIFYIFVAKSR